MIQMTTTETGRYTRAIVDYAARFDFNQLPGDAVDQAKTLVLDTLGAMLLGSSPAYASSWLTGELARMTGGRPECTVVGRAFKTSVESAALANGTLGYAADVEGGRAARQHAAAVLIPTALAMCEREWAGGKRLLAALALGYEVSCRVSEACRTPHSYPRSFHPSAIFGYFGAAAAAGHVLGLDAARLDVAISLAGSNAGGLVTWVNDPTENSRPLVIGLAARGGVTAALLAKLGFGGPAGILDPGKYSIYDAYSGEMHLHRLVGGLGDEPLWITRTTLYKRHPCCGDIHTGLDALITLREQHGFRPDDIAEIEHRVKADRAPVVDNNPLRSHCAQYIMGVAAVNGKIASDDILTDRRADPRIRAMIDRVRFIGDPELDSWEAPSPAVVRVTLKDGRALSLRVDWPKGMPPNPLTHQELESKFLELATTRIPRDRAERLLELIAGLERIEDVSQVTELLRVPE
jgi:2-methylcitrate dehydratase PrpD